MAKGHKEGVKESARNLKKLGVAIEVISQATGLSKEEIEIYKTFFEKRTYLNTQKVKPLKNSGFTFQFVELEGIEPSSKRGNHKLSTCLSLPKFFVQEQNQSHQFLPYPLKFHQKRKATSDYPRCNCTTEPECFGATASE